MPFLKKIKTPAGIIGIWELSESNSKILPHYHFSEMEKRDFEKIKNDKRRREFLSVRLLLKELLNIKTEIIYEKSGRPKLKNDPCNISISHSSDLAVVLISENNAGIDAENISRNIDPVAKRFLSKEETQWIDRENNKKLAQIIYWCAKEAIFKCSPTPAIQFNTQITIHPFQIKHKGKIRATLSVNNNSLSFSLWYFFQQNNVVVYGVED